MKNNEFIDLRNFDDKRKIVESWFGFFKNDEEKNNNDETQSMNLEDLRGENNNEADTILIDSIPNNNSIDNTSPMEVVNQEENTNNQEIQDDLFLSSKNSTYYETWINNKNYFTKSPYYKSNLSNETLTNLQNRTWGDIHKQLLIIKDVIFDVKKQNKKIGNQFENLIKNIVYYMFEESSVDPISVTATGIDMVENSEQYVDGKTKDKITQFKLQMNIFYDDIEGINWGKTAIEQKNTDTSDVNIQQNTVEKDVVEVKDQETKKIEKNTQEESKTQKTENNNSKSEDVKEQEENTIEDVKEVDNSDDSEKIINENVDEVLSVIADLKEEVPNDNQSINETLNEIEHITKNNRQNPRTSVDFLIQMLLVNIKRDLSDEKNINKILSLAKNMVLGLSNVFNNINVDKFDFNIDETALDDDRKTTDNEVKKEDEKNNNINIEDRVNKMQSIIEKINDYAEENKEDKEKILSVKKSLIDTFNELIVEVDNGLFNDLLLDVRDIISTITSKSNKNKKTKKSNISSIFKKITKDVNDSDVSNKSKIISLIELTLSTIEEVYDESTQSQNETVVVPKTEQQESTQQPNQNTPSNSDNDTLTRTINNFREKYESLKQYHPDRKEYWESFINKLENISKKIKSEKSQETIIKILNLLLEEESKSRNINLSNEYINFEQYVLDEDSSLYDDLDEVAKNYQEIVKYEDENLQQIITPNVPSIDTITEIITVKDLMDSGFSSVSTKATSLIKNLATIINNSSGSSELIGVATDIAKLIKEYNYDEEKEDNLEARIKKDEILDKILMSISKVSTITNITDEKRENILSSLESIKDSVEMVKAESRNRLKTEDYMERLMRLLSPNQKELFEKIKSTNDKKLKMSNQKEVKEEYIARAISAMITHNKSFDELTKEEVKNTGEFKNVFYNIIENKYKELVFSSISQAFSTRSNVIKKIGK